MKRVVTLSVAASLLVACVANALVSSDQATQAVKRSIHRTFGDTKPRYVHCPSKDRYDGKQNCIAEFRNGNKWRFRFYAVEGNTPTVKTSFRRTWTRKFRSCHGSPSETRYAPGVLRSNEGACDYLIAGDVQYELDHGQSVSRNFTHGTGTGYYPEVFLYHCSRSGRLVRCRNSLGDAFTYQG